ncbi:MAG: FAD-binding protein [Rhodospirillales bacterium]|nr:FAD-binding protein [Rhodospirillales bacterium]
MDARTESWDETVDVVVVGFGFAGGTAAIEAHDLGANVLLAEKNRTPGGISICSAGGVRIAKDRDAAFAYLKATNAGTTPDEPLAALAEGMATISAFIEEIAAAAGANPVINWMPGNYPFEGFDTFGFISIADYPGLDLNEKYPHVRGLRGGARLFAALHHNVETRGIPVRYDTAAERLVTSVDGAVTGVLLKDASGTKRVRARGGVILACGGFEADTEMQAQYWQGKPVMPQAYMGNTGDGIRMAQAVGADLWHMWHYHGTYGMPHPDPNYPFGMRLMKFPDWIPEQEEPDDVPAFFSALHGKRMPWIVVDARGNRFMNEYPPYVQDTGHRDMEIMDPVSRTHLRNPAWLVIDAAGLASGQLGLQTYNDHGQTFMWSADNKQEIELGIIKGADTLAELAGIMGAPAGALEETVRRWNEQVAAGEDKDYGRIPESLVPIKEPPFYTTELRPLVGNTQGGPVHDARQRVLNPFGDVIEGLYTAGELGSVFGHLYISGGNLAECFVGGRAAAREAFNNAPKNT